MAAIIISPMNSPTGYFVYALHKSASMFLWKFYADVSRRLELPFFSRNNTPPNEKALDRDIRTSFCLGPLRDFNLVRPRLRHVARLEHILQVRDPRDILVSQYFSFGWIHDQQDWDKNKLQERDWIRGVTVDDYVLERAKKKDMGGREGLKQRYKPLLKTLKGQPEHVTLLKYEDMVLDYGNWIPKALAPLGVKSDDPMVSELWEAYHGEFEVSGEEQRHRRKVIPGDHIEKLKPETIGRLNEIFAEELAALGYQ